MKYKFFTNSERAWQAMFEAASLAKTSIYIEMYIFQNDMERFNFFSLLKKKTKEGVRIRIILDSFGSGELDNAMLLDLRNHGIEIFFLSYFFHRMHRKILIVDEEIAFIGGVNLHQSAKIWNDLMVQMKGIIVSRMVRSFANSYKNAGGKDATILFKAKKMTIGKINSWIVESSPVRNIFNMKRMYKVHINQANVSIVLATPYFMPKRWFAKLLHQAVLRGVRVDILVPKNTDLFIVDRVNYFYMHKLSSLGVNFYLEDKMNHAKAMVIDDREGLVGSQNLDFLSFEFNSEIGVFLRDIDAVTELSAILKEWQNNAELFDFKRYKPRWFDYLLSPFIKIFAKIM